MDNALEQWSLTGGKHNSLAISVFLIFSASSSDKPLTRSVIYELEAMALPHPNVLNLTSEMMPFSSTRICSFMTSPHLMTRIGVSPTSTTTKPKPTRDLRRSTDEARADRRVVLGQRTDLEEGGR